MTTWYTDPEYCSCAKGALRNPEAEAQRHANYQRLGKHHTDSAFHNLTQQILEFFRPAYKETQLEFLKSQAENAATYVLQQQINVAKVESEYFVQKGTRYPKQLAQSEEADVFFVEEQGIRRSSGTGFFISIDGERFFLSNNHVLPADAVENASGKFSKRTKVSFHQVPISMSKPTEMVMSQHDRFDYILLKPKCDDSETWRKIQGYCPLPITQAETALAEMFHAALDKCCSMRDEIWKPIADRLGIDQTPAQNSEHLKPMREAIQDFLNGGPKWLDISSATCNHESSHTCKIRFVKNFSEHTGILGKKDQESRHSDSLCALLDDIVEEFFGKVYVAERYADKTREDHIAQTYAEMAIEFFSRRGSLKELGKSITFGECHLATPEGSYLLAELWESIFDAGIIYSFLRGLLKGAENIIGPQGPGIQTIENQSAQIHARQYITVGMQSIVIGAPHLMLSQKPSVLSDALLTLTSKQFLTSIGFPHSSKKRLSTGLGYTYPSEFSSNVTYESLLTCVGSSGGPVFSIRMDCSGKLYPVFLAVHFKGGRGLCAQHLKWYLELKMRQTESHVASFVQALTHLEIANEENSRKWAQISLQVNKGDDIAAALVEAGGIGKFTSFVQDALKADTMHLVIGPLQAITLPCDMPSQHAEILQRGGPLLIESLIKIMGGHNLTAAYFAANTICNLLGNRELWKTDQWNKTANSVHSVLNEWNLDNMKPLSRIRFDPEEVFPAIVNPSKMESPQHHFLLWTMAVGVKHAYPEYALAIRNKQNKIIRALNHAYQGDSLPGIKTIAKTLLDLLEDKLKQR